MNLLTSLLSLFAPPPKRRPVRAYEAGGMGRRFGDFGSKASSANTEIERSLPRMRNRHRQLVRDNAWAANAVRAIVTNTVGYGITGEVFAGTAKDQRLTDLWLSWAENITADVSGVNNFYGQQSLALRSIAEAGEVLVRRRWRTDLKVPFQIELIEPDFLDQGKSQNLPSGGRIVQGVEFNPAGRIVAYWLFEDHPGDSLARSFQSKRVDAKDIAHIFRVDRPQQARGVPWGHAAILTLRDLDGFEDAFLFRQKLANCFMATETDIDSLGQVDGLAEDELGTELNSLEPGIIYRPKAGRELKFSDPPIAAEYNSYVDSVLHRVAAAYGISHQALTGNLAKVNFSSGRMGWMDFQRNIDVWRWNMLIPRMCDRVGGWFLEAAELRQVPVPPDVRFEWTPPRREMISPEREVPPLIAAIRAGITSLPAVHREYGQHTARILAEIEQTNALLDEKELVLDSDPRRVTKVGGQQPVQPEEEET